MTEWWSYRLSDFLLFSPRTYWRMYELHNEALWPLPALTLLLGIAALAVAALRPAHHGRLIAVALAALWAFIAWSFLWQRYAAINWAAAYVAPLFAAEAAVLLVGGGMLGRLSFEGRGARRIIGVLLAALALAYPLASPLSGRSWQAAELFGIAPDPTAIGTLGLLLLARGRLAVLLLPIPLLWCLVSAATLWAMDEPQALLPLAAMLSVGAAEAAAIRAALARSRARRPATR